MRRTIYLLSTRAPSEHIRSDTNYCSMSIINQNDSTPFVMVNYFYPMIIKIKLLIFIFKLRFTGAMKIEYRRKSIQISPINKRETAKQLRRGFFLPTQQIEFAGPRSQILGGGFKFQKKFNLPSHTVPSRQYNYDFHRHCEYNI